MPNLQAKKGNVPSKDKLPSCSTWFRLKAERKIMIQRRRLSKLISTSPLEHQHDATAIPATPAVAEDRQVVTGIAELPQA